MRHRHLRKDYGTLSELIAIGSSGASGNPSSVIPNPTWLQANWYVDPVAGNDGNTGLSPATAVKTITGGIIYKWGTREPILQQNTTIFLLKPETLNQEYIALSPIMVGGTIFGVVGTPQLVTTMVLGAVTAKNRATPQLLTAAGFGSGLLAPGQLVVNTTRGGSRAFIDSITGGVATFTQPLAQASIADATAFPPFVPAEVDTWTTGDSVSVYTVPLLNLKEFTARGGDTTVSETGGIWWVQYVYIPDVTGVDGDSVFAMGSIDSVGNLFDSRVGPYIILGVPGGEGIESNQAVGCWLNGGGTAQYATVIGGAVNTFGLSLGDYGAVDGDCICNPSFSAAGGVAFCGMAYTVTTGQASGPFNGATLKLDDINTASGYSVFVWGPGGFDVSDNSTCEKVVATIWATIFLVKGPTTLDGAGTGTSYAPGTPGVFTDGRTVNAADLDTYDGLQNPRTGARYCGTG
jgi:hypothetical protein